ncbi:hydrophobic/amphiphilic exporter-1, HAE1 family [Streptoalloteichus tenebrarius]|uniref:Hydrophobic/amphiphilic exporter-1, HAE1 family n=1 Tax=Streptoalloteichus tenebrarius (strain ATCC 17920 / DSM 40477 / JCM 4838 / CBS 697.72 / NBRC 16177 / NCIMB 11028 / NRRL B-12390 / A12253. 1 / ISP 5477) TaxID=1933 RepID=A0ABT1HYT1_STRSD|nr:efflux RND transporter permease subunit [Streptoalloteichus tenebrarius]MCP2260678.1 hydrophobic/amphiphilic exporter-1, HAE1 family [Streptoalloteichus tenebrarius]BFF03790.1 efflux RND transporter permease subunit [Streptoalloteichus tenebrarius]
MSVLARLSLAHRGLIALIAVAVTGFGAWAIPSLKQQMLPDLEFPAVFVSSAYPGSSPATAEQQVTLPIEKAVRGVPGVKKVTSFSQSGMSTVQVSFDYGTKIADASSHVERAISQVRGTLPTGVDPRLVTGSTSDMPVIQIAATGPGDQQEFARKLRQLVLPDIQAIEGVREASLTGARDPVVTITPDPAKMAQAGLSPEVLGAVLKASGLPLPGGTLTQDGKSSTVSVGGTFTSLDEIRDVYLNPAAMGGGAGGQRGGAAPAPVRLGDIATVARGETESTTLTRTDGKPSLGVAVTATPEGNAVRISHAVSDLLPKLQKSLGDGAKLTVVFDQAPFVERSVEGLTTEGLLGLVFAVLVILVFLMSVRSTLVTAVSIPLSVMIALISLWIGDLSLNMLTLGALTIAVGRVVDDSIVVLENIKRHLGYGERKRDAILTAVREVAGAVTSSTLTTVAVFAPIAVVGGMVGELFRPFALTVTVALLASLVVSLTVIPVLAYWFLKPSARQGEDPERVRAEADERERRGVLQRSYVPVIRWSLRHRAATLAIAVGIFLGTIALVPGLKTNFLDSAGDNSFSVSQEMPVGTSLESTDAAAKRVEDVVSKVEGVKSYQVTVGGGGGFSLSSDSAKANFSITTDAEADQAKIERTLRDRLGALKDAGRLTVQAGGGGGAGNSKLEVVVQARDEAVLRSAAEKVRAVVAETPGTRDVSSNLADSAPMVDVKVDRQAAARHGLTEAQIGQAVGEAFRGGTVSRAVLDGVQQDVVLRAGPAPANLDALRALQVAAPTGPVRLDAVAQVKATTGPTQINRIDGARSVTVTANAGDQDLGSVTAELTRRLQALSLPAGATYTLGGASSEQQSAFSDLGLALVVAVALVFVIMVATFRSLVQPLILLVSIPFAATGALGLLLVTGTSLGVPALIGMLMLIGIVVTNAIVLIDLVNHYRAQGMGITESVVEGGRHRLRPILMTAVATICALLPMSLGLTGDGGFIAQPLAVVVIGGLISSTLLTLVVVPVLYSLVEGAKERARRRRGRRNQPPAEESVSDAREAVPSGA